MTRAPTQRFGAKSHPQDGTSADTPARKSIAAAVLDSPSFTRVSLQSISTMSALHAFIAVKSAPASKIAADIHSASAASTGSEIAPTGARHLPCSARH